MSYQQNAMNMASSRPPSHVYSPYQSMAAKPPPTSAPQLASVPSAGYNGQVYLMPGSTAYVNPSFYQSGVDGKFAGNRGVPDSTGMYLSMQPGMMFPQPPGTMILQNGQQMIAMATGPPQMGYQAPGVHQGHSRFGHGQPSSGQYSMGAGGGGTGAGGGAMPQQSQQQQSQQQYYKGGWTNQSHQQQHQQSLFSTVPKRERKALQIVNPNTGKEVNLNADQSSASSATNDAETSVAAVTPEQQTIAAQFAAQVAATLHNPGSTHGSAKPGATTDDKEKNSCSSATPSGDEQHPSVEHPVAQSSDKPTSGKLVAPKNAAPSPAPTISSGTDAATEAAVPVSVGLPLEEKSRNVLPESDQSESSLLLDEMKQPLSSSPSSASSVLMTTNDLGPVLPTTAVKEEMMTPEAVLDALAATRDDGKLQQQTKETPVVLGSLTAPVVGQESNSSLVTTDNGNRKKNRKKSKELNSKGKGLGCSDMDAFIDGASDGENEKTGQPSSQSEATNSETAASAVAAAVANKTKDAVSSNSMLSDLSASVVPTADAAAEANKDAEKTKEKKSDTVDSETGFSHSDEKVVPIDDTSLTASSPGDVDVSKDEVKAVDRKSRGDAETFQAEEEKDRTQATLASSATVASSDVIDKEDEDADDGESGTELDAPLTSTAAADGTSGNKTELQYTYSEDQWSPLNPEGKKQYDRSFMLQLQFANPSIVKPAGLPPHLDIILNEPRGKNDFSRQSSVDPMSPIDFTPGFIKQSLSGGGGGGGNRSLPRRGVSGSGMKRAGVGGEQQRKVISVSLEQNITLHTTENAWKPVLASKPSKDAELATEELYKKIRGILNKLTPQKFQTLIQQVQDLPINSEERLTKCIDIMFEKAISEPNFSVAYANMARCLINISVPVDKDQTQMVGFRKLLLNKCQQEFEKDKMEELDIRNLENQINEANSDEKKKQLIEKRNETIYKAKRRSLGNIRFIGELFKLKMLTEKIMHECLGKLLKSNEDEDSLECLCQLLTTIGQDIDKKAPGTTIMNKYFAELQELVDLKKTTSRIKFMIQDVIELRSNKWVPRRQNNDPKTIEQIHKEAEQEEQEKQLVLQKFAQDQRNRRGPGPSATPGRSGSGMGQNAVEDGWTAVGRAPKTIVDPARMKLTKQPMDENFQLGPGGRGMSAWHRGSNGGAKAQEAERPTSTPNRFSALGSESMDARSRPSGRPGGNYTGRLSGPQSSRAPGSRQSQERTFDSSFRGSSIGRGGPGAPSPAGSRSASRETRGTRDTKGESQMERRDVPRSSATDDKKEISEEEIEKKTKSLMDEYLHGHDIKEAALCVKELGSSKSLQRFVYHSLLQNLERSVQARQFTGKLHLHLVRTNQMTVGNYVDGLRNVLELADEMTIDIPRIWEYLGELIGPMVEDGTVSMEFLRPASEPLLACDKAGLVVSRVLHTVAHNLGHHKAAELWHTSGLSWNDFMKADTVKAFLTDQKLQFTEDQPAPSSSRLSTEEIMLHLTKLLDDPVTDSEKLIDWIDVSVDENMVYKASFVRAFTSSLCSSCVPTEKNVNVDKEKLKRFLPVLQKYTINRKELQVQVLFSLQAFVNRLEHPPGLLRSFFDTLYDDDVITEEAFYEWKNSSEMSESAGKGVALQSVAQFFQWLENDDDGEGMTTKTTSTK